MKKHVRDYVFYFGLNPLARSDDVSYQNVRKHSVEFSFQVSFDIIIRSDCIYMLYFPYKFFYTVFEMINLA